MHRLGRLRGGRLAGVESGGRRQLQDRDEEGLVQQYQEVRLHHRRAEPIEKAAVFKDLTLKGIVGITCNPTQKDCKRPPMKDGECLGLDDGTTFQFDFMFAAGKVTVGRGGTTTPDPADPTHFTVTWTTSLPCKATCQDPKCQGPDCANFDALVDALQQLQDADRLPGNTHHELWDRLQKAMADAGLGHEKRAVSYLEQFVARAENQIREDPAARNLLVTEAQRLIDHLRAIDAGEETT